MISHLVGQYHVMTPWREVARAIIARMRHGKATYYELPRATRRQFLREVRRCHLGNRRLYLDVMRGAL